MSDTFTFIDPEKVPHPWPNLRVGVPGLVAHLRSRPPSQRLHPTDREALGAETAQNRQRRGVKGGAGC